MYGISADAPPMNTAVVEKLALPFPILSDPDRSEAITPLGFADENDPRQISRPGTVVVAPTGDVVFAVTGQDYADRPDEDVLLDALADLGLERTSQDPPTLGEAHPGERAMPFEGLTHYFRGAKFAVLAVRGRHRELGEDFRHDTKRYVQMLDRYIEAMGSVEGRK